MAAKYSRTRFADACELVCRLSQMILDKVFHGVLDQEKGRLVVYDEPVEDVSPLHRLSNHVGVCC